MLPFRLSRPSRCLLNYRCNGDLSTCKRTASTALDSLPFSSSTTAVATASNGGPFSSAYSSLSLYSPLPLHSLGTSSRGTRRRIASLHSVAPPALPLAHLLPRTWKPTNDLATSNAEVSTVQDTSPSEGARVSRRLSCSELAYFVSELNFAIILQNELALSM